MIAPIVVALHLHFAAPRERTTAAFGPVAESRWSPEFRPHFIVPDVPAQASGAVFTTGDGNIWLLHDYDPAAGFVQYVIVDSGSQVVTLTIRVAAAPAGSDVTMTYDIVPLGDAGVTHARALQQNASALTAQMQAAVAGYLAAQPAGS
jgi:hypothetical protein